MLALILTIAAIIAVFSAYHFGWNFGWDAGYGRGNDFANAQRRDLSRFHGGQLTALREQHAKILDATRAEGIAEGRRQFEAEIIEKQAARRAKADAEKAASAPAPETSVPASEPAPISKRVKTPRLGKSTLITKG